MLLNFTNINLSNHILIFLSSFFLALIITPLVRKLALRYDFIAKPREDRWHKNPTALLGGVAIYTAFITPALLFYNTQQIKGFIIGGSLFFLLGLIDDFKQLPAQIKLLSQILISCVAIFFGIALPLPQAYLSIPLTILWITAITNAFNLLDNMDGLACGVGTITSIIFYISCLISGNAQLSIFALILAGTTLGFLPYNFNPAKIFMGDCGSMFLGFSLASLAILGTAKQVSHLIVTLIVPVLILAVPIFDTILVTLIRRFSGRSILKGGQDHISHRLVSLGLSEKKTVVLLYSLSCLFGLMAIFYAKIDFFIVSIISALTIIVLLFFGIFLAEVKTYPEEDIDTQRERLRDEGKVVLEGIFVNKRRMLEVLTDFILICIAYYSAYLLRFELKLNEVNLQLIKDSLPWVIIFRIGCFWYFGLYRGVWRYIGIQDLLSIFKAVTLSSVLAVIALTFIFRFQDYSRVVFAIDWLLCIFFISGIRIFIRLLQEYFASLSKGKKNVLIFGAGDMGELVLREIKRNKSLNYNPIGFIDDDYSKVGRQIHGVPILGTRNDIPYLLKKESIQEILVAVSSTKIDKPDSLVALLKEFSIPYKELSGILD